MAINPETQYPGKIAPSTPQYPYGQARNVTTPGDGTGTPWEAAIVNDMLGFQQALLTEAAIVPSGTPDEVGASQYLDALLAVSGRQLALDATVTYNIPTDFANLQDALDFLTKTRSANRAKVTVNIETGHALVGGFRIQDTDLSYVTLTSDDATVPVSPGFTTVNDSDLDAGVPREANIGFLAVRAKMPEWDILVDMSATSNATTGYKLDWESAGIVRPAKGVVNTDAGGSAGVNLRVTSGSVLHGYQSNFSGAASVGAAVTVNGRVSIAESNLSGAGLTGLDISRGSMVYANQVDVSGSQRGIYARRSWVSAQGANYTNCSVVGLWCSLGTRAAARDGIFTGATKDVQVDDGAIVDISGSTKGGGELSPSDSTGIVNFNAIYPRGTITNEDYPAGSVEYLTAETSLTAVGATQQNVASLTYATILDEAGEVTVHSGTIYSADVGLRITIDGVVVLNDISRFQGRDDGGTAYAVTAIPACKSKTSLKIEAYNRSSVAKDMGWRLYKRN